MRLIHRYGNVRQIRFSGVWISWSPEPFKVGSRLVVWAWHRRLWPRNAIQERP